MNKPSFQLPKLSEKENTRNTTPSASKYTSPLRKRLLRYGETMESLFLLQTDTSDEHRRLCRQIVDGNDDSSLWRRVLENTSLEKAPATNVIRLYRRATSRIAEDPEDDNVFAIWISFAKVLYQCNQQDDARFTLKHLQNIYRRKAQVYLELAQMEQDESSAKEVLELGIERNAEPLSALQEALDQRKACETSNMSLESTEEDTNRSVKFELKPLASREFDVSPQAKQSTEKTALKTPSFNITSSRVSMAKSSSRRPPLLAKRLRPQGLSGKAERIDPENSMELLTDSESETEKEPTKPKAKKPKITKMDISYMLDWDPNKPSSKPESAKKVVKTPAPTASSSSSSLSNSSGKKPLDTPAADKTAPTKRHSETGVSQHSMEDVNPDFLPLVSKRNILHVNGIPYAKLGVIGKGGSCRVYRALSKDCNVVAIKKVTIEDKDTKTIESYANEIALLKRLRGNPAIIQLYDSEVDLKREAIFLTMELGEVDLNHVLRQQSLAAESSGNGPRQLNMNFIRLTWQQMLGAVHSIHGAKIIHGDLKPANFLFVRGALKLIDFGIAKAIQNEDTTNIYRESHIGTLNYMSPEAIITGEDKRMKVGRASDIWSLGCILYQMVYGRTPFADLHMIQKLQAIIDPNHRIKYPDTVDDDAIDAIQQCLQRKPEDRPPIVGPRGLLNEHIFLNSKAKSK